MNYTPYLFINRIKVNYQVVDPAVEAAQARLDAMRTGRYLAPKPKQKSQRKKEEQSKGKPSCVYLDKWYTVCWDNLAKR